MKSRSPKQNRLGEVLFDQLEAMIPANPLAALTEPNFLSIIAFTIAFGLFTLAVGGRRWNESREQQLPDSK